MPAPAFVLLDNVTGTGLGYILGIQGENMAAGAAMKNNFIVPYEIVVTAIGGTATVQLQTGATVGGLATVGGNIVLASGQTWKFVGRTQARLITMNVSAISGATVSGYIRMHANSA